MAYAEEVSLVARAAGHQFSFYFNYLLLFFLSYGSQRACVCDSKVPRMQSQLLLKPISVVRTPENLRLLYYFLHSKNLNQILNYQFLLILALLVVFFVLPTSFNLLLSQPSKSQTETFFQIIQTHTNTSILIQLGIYLFFNFKCSSSFFNI